MDGRTDTESYNIIPRHTLAAGYKNMDWVQHISEIFSKAARKFGFLRRNLAFAPKRTKEVAYKTLVRPKLEYAAPIWSKPFEELVPKRHFWRM